MLREPRPGWLPTALVTALVTALAASLTGCGAAAGTAGGHHLAEVDHPLQRTIAAGVPGEMPQRASARGVTLADGEVPAGTTVLDDSVPAVARLEPALESALREAAADAARDGLELDVNSGWRSRAYQQELFAQAIRKYGSEAAAVRWVARPGTSVHEAGQAVDLGPAATTSWLAEHGASYGLCRTYANEPWHFELRPAAATDGCPARYADAAHDPRTPR